MSDFTERSNLDNTEVSAKQAGILKNAVKMVFGTFLSRFLGLFREVLMAAYFDKPVTDAWAIAFRLPNFFRRVFFDGVLANSLLPDLVDFERYPTLDKQKQINKIYSIYFFFFFIFSLIGSLWAREIVVWLMPYLQFNTDQTSEVYLIRIINYFKIMIFFVFLVSQYAFFMTRLNAKKKFFWASFAPALLNIIMIGSLLWAYQCQILDEGITLNKSYLAWGAVLGGLAQVLFLIPFLKRDQLMVYLVRFHLVKDMLPQLKKLFIGLFSGSLYYIVILLNVSLTAYLGLGVSSYFHYTDRLIELPMTLISTTLATVFLTETEVLHKENKIKQSAEVFFQGLKLNIFFTLAACLGLFFYAEPICYLLFQNQHLTKLDLEQLSVILKWSSVSLFFASLNRYFILIFVIEEKLIWLVKSNLVMIGFYLIMSHLLTEKFKIQGLLIANLLTFLLLTLILNYLRQKTFAKGQGLSVKTIAKYLSIVIVLLGVRFIYNQFFIKINLFTDIQRLNQFTSLFLAILLTILSLFVIAKVFFKSEFKSYLNFKKNCP